MSSNLTTVSLTPKEQELVFWCTVALIPWVPGLVFLAKQQAEAVSTNLGGGGDNTPGNAALHSAWNAQMTLYIGAALATSFGTAHEIEPPHSGVTDDQTMMDLYNNHIGRLLVVNPGSVLAPKSYNCAWVDVTERVRLAGEQGRLFWFDGAYNPRGWKSRSRTEVHSIVRQLHPGYENYAS